MSEEDPQASPRRALDSSTPDPWTAEPASYTAPSSAGSTGARYAADQDAEVGAHAAPAPGSIVKWRFRRSLLRTLASTIIPGSGLIGTGFTAIGVLLVILFVGAVGALAFIAITSPTTLLSSVVNPTVMMVTTYALFALGLVWVTVIAGTQLVTRPKRASLAQRGIGALTVTALSAMVSIPLAIAGVYAYQSARLVNGIFEGENDTKSGTRPTISEASNPWGDRTRLNILLLGGDSGENRADSLGVRTDTIMMASIDLKTGDTVIIQVPRNMARTPFPAGSDLAKVYPKGFFDGKDANNAEFLANAIWRNVPAAHPNLFTNTDYAGGDAIKLAMSATTGLNADYFAMVNIDGIAELVDAMGGVTVNINFKIAMGGSTERRCGELGYLQPGENVKLTGDQAMWYARSRCNDPQSDFGRMQRQSCLVYAIIRQANPTVMATRYEAIAKSAGNMVMTDIPQEALSPLIDLSWKVKNANIRRVVFINNRDGFVSSNPNFDLMRARVQAAIEAVGTQSSGAATDAPDSTQTSQPTGATSPTAGRTTSAARPTTGTTSSVAGGEDVSDACAYNPV